MSDTKNPAGDTPVDRLAKFARVWSGMSQRDGLIYGLEVGGEKHSELNVSDLRAVLSDRADLLAACQTALAYCEHLKSSIFAVEPDHAAELRAAIAKATGA